MLNHGGHRGTEKILIYPKNILGIYSDEPCRISIRFL